MRRFSSRRRRLKTSMLSGGLSRDAAGRVEMEIVATCRRLAKHPLIGTQRQDITPLAVRFWTVTKFPNYVIVYRPETVPLQVVAVLHGKRDLKEVLEGRS